MLKRIALTFRRAGRERGQMLLVVAMLIVPISFALGAVAVDATMWQSERRGAQKDADLAALAGAWELVGTNSTASDAEDAANANQATNDESGNADVLNLTVGTDCEGGDDGGRLSHVKVDIDHDSRTFFAEAFGVAVPEIGAHACARAGSTLSGTDIVPIEMSNNIGPCWVDDPGSTNPNRTQPNLGAACPIEVGAQGGNPRGVLDLQAPGNYCSRSGGSGDLEDLIADGAPGRCDIHLNPGAGCDPDNNGPWYDCVAVQTGNPQKILDGFETRIARETLDCDIDNDRIEELDEVVKLVFDSPDPWKRIYEARDCDFSIAETQPSSRLITIIVLDDSPPPGNEGHPIVGLAGMYVMGCWESNDDPPVPATQGDLDPYCRRGGQVALTGASSTHQVSLPAHHRCGHTSSPTCTPVPTNTPTGPTPTPTPGGGGGGGGGIGHQIVFANFVNLTLAGGQVGGWNPNSTLVGISLVE
jgi:hypothetical protein